MTKEVIENVVKRYPYVTDAIGRDQTKAVFYFGKRRFVIEITDEIKIVCEIVELIYNREPSELIRQILKDIISCKSDVNIIMRMPYGKNYYYAKKQKIVDKIYRCCIARGLVSFEEVLNEAIV